MKNLRFDYLPSVVLLTLTAGLSIPVNAQTFIKIDGSSTVFPITEAVADDYQASKKGAVKVTIGIAGTGGGFKKFCKGETDISDASRPILKKEMEECAKNGIKYMELPIAFDALTVVVNPKNKFLSKITVEELKKMWEPAAQGTIMRWKQINPAWPDTPIKLFGAGADSGTFDYFTDAIVGKTKSSRTDYVASEDDNVVVQGVARDPNSIGYFGYAYYLENSKKLKLVPIVHQAGKPAVAPSVQSVIDGSYQPLSRPIFIYVNAKAAERPEVKGFVDFYLANAQKAVKEAKYIPLTEKDYKHASLNFSNKKTGTAFGGEPEIGVKIADLLRRDPKE
ncbi:PstS family phosphate ABC transporter substrate-binding protein [Undibacterium oligocarboniphilum]|nr:PstS family phosphate ABC transporter substrate-binding protein [Undibacterium oligocarboniphilum]MBC3871715.1 PstS family phosphate ABC transporter substrate-binding protein [Undibacterium oligocarboniphilum]